MKVELSGTNFHYLLIKKLFPTLILFEGGIILYLIFFELWLNNS